jgi:translation initiation factor 2 gamma subunit (eIF-2gamma)
MYFSTEAFEVESMLKKTEISEQISQDEQFKVKEKLEVALLRLQALRKKSSELTRQCEELKKLSSERKEKVCSKCGDAIESGREITFRDSAGIETRYYHKECFEELLIS